MITGTLPKGFVYLHVNNMSRYPSRKKEGKRNKWTKMNKKDKKPEETQHNLLHNIREGQLHGSMQSKLEFVMEVGQEDHWLAKLQILSGFLN